MEANSVRLKGTVALTIDDDQDSRILLKMILHQAGASVVEAASGAEALKIFPTVRPDVVLCDLRMPEIDGYQVLERIRALESNHRTSVPVIAVTAFRHLEDYAETLRPGLNFFLVEPINPDELIRAIADALGKSSAL